MANKYHPRYFSDRDDVQVLASPVPLLHGKARNPRSYNLGKVVPLQWYTLKKSTQTPGFGSDSARAIQGGQIEPKEPQRQIRDLFHHRGSESVSHALLAIKHDRMIATVVWTPNSVGREARQLDTDMNSTFSPSQAFFMPPPSARAREVFSILPSLPSSTYGLLHRDLQR
jgi:hypothetical protein